MLLLSIALTTAIKGCRYTFSLEIQCLQSFVKNSFVIKKRYCFSEVDVLS